VCRVKLFYVMLPKRGGHLRGKESECVGSHRSPPASGMATYYDLSSDTSDEEAITELEGVDVSALPALAAIEAASGQMAVAHAPVPVEDAGVAMEAEVAPAVEVKTEAAVCALSRG
jgi:hypothetical protein